MVNWSSALNSAISDIEVSTLSCHKSGIMANFLPLPNPIAF